jgi:ABC-2 type transport system permease protein
MKTFKTLLKTELKLSLRDMNMPIFALIIPVIVTVVLGLIYGTTPAYEGSEHTLFSQSFGALSTIAILSGGTMGLPLLIADYRGKQILKRFKVTPISPVMILLVSLTVYSVYAVVSLILVYIVSAIFFEFQMIGSCLHFLGSYLLTLISMLSIGMFVGGVAPNMKMASTIASLLFFPMLIFSGATIPYDVMPYGLQRFADLLPLTQAIHLLQSATMGMTVADVIFPIFLLTTLSLGCFCLAVKFFKWE